MENLKPETLNSYLGSDTDFLHTTENIPLFQDQETEAKKEHQWKTTLPLVP